MTKWAPSKKILDINGPSVYYVSMLNATDKKEIQDIFAKEASLKRYTR